MALIKIELSAPPVDGAEIKFKAPCDCTAVTGMLVAYPDENGDDAQQEFTFRDSHGNNLAGIGNLFSAGAYVKVIVDTARGYAYLQNADTNGFLNTAILGTYTHDSGSLTGRGENGKFKATSSGTITTINVNGRTCAVKCGEETSMDLVAGCWYTFILDGNTVNFNSGGAGGGLNFRVVGGIAAPVSPKENTIWVNTSTEIPDYVFSATEPELPTYGLVWFQTGDSSQVAFSVSKKYRIMVYPISAKQYIGTWQDVTAMSYQGGAWQEWVRYLYIALDSDNWTSKGVTGYGGSHSVSDGVLKVTKKGSASPNAITRVQAFTTSKVDFSGYVTLEIEMSLSRADCEELTIGVTDSDRNWLAKEKISQTTEKKICSVDITGISNGYITIDMFGNNSETVATITAIRLVGEGGSVSPTGYNGVAMLTLTSNANTPVLAEIDGITYGLENVTLNESPTENTYDFTVL